jgi:hypothetical protein
MHEIGSRLADAIHHYLREETLSKHEIKLIRAYLVQWIEAGTWDQNPHLNDAGRAELKSLRDAAQHIASRRDIDQWVEVATDWGMDPL